MKNPKNKDEVVIVSDGSKDYYLNFSSFRRKLAKFDVAHPLTLPFGTEEDFQRERLQLGVARYGKPVLLK